MCADKYLLVKITLVPEPVTVSDSQEITHHDSAREKEIVDIVGNVYIYDDFS